VIELRPSEKLFRRPGGAAGIILPCRRGGQI